MKNMSKNWMKRVISAVFMTVLMVCCSNESVVTGNESTTTTLSTNIDANTLALGKMIANAKLQESVMNGNTNWTEQTEITDYYPIYTAGIDGVSHIEFKLSTNGEDAGYILASVTDNDILVPECSDGAKSTTEIYRDALNRTDFNVYRYNWFESAAESIDNGRGVITVLASIGFDGGDIRVHNCGRGADNQFNDKYATMKSKYAAKLKANKCLPYYDKAELEKYYEQQTAAGRGEVESTVTKTYKLRGRFGSKFHTPHWCQNKRPDGTPMGCSVVAWGEIFAYWKEFRGRDDLFKDVELWKCWNWNTSTTIYDQKVYDDLCKIAEYCKTTNGSTYPYNFYRALEYAGYSNPLNCYTNKQIIWSNGYADALNVAREINDDRPVMLSVHAENGSIGVGVSNHTVVVEEVERTYYKSNDFTTQYGYKINCGWSTKDACVTIYLFGSDYSSVYNAFFINLE